MGRDERLPSYARRHLPLAMRKTVSYERRTRSVPTGIRCRKCRNRKISDVGHRYEIAFPEKIRDWFWY